MGEERRTKTQKLFQRRVAAFNCFFSFEQEFSVKRSAHITDNVNGETSTAVYGVVESFYWLCSLLFFVLFELSMLCAGLCDTSERRKLLWVARV